MRFWHFPRPTIATVSGPCLAGACELALACDITIASEDAFFGEPELKFGAGIVAMILPWVDHLTGPIHQPCGTAMVEGVASLRRLLPSDLHVAPHFLQRLYLILSVASRFQMNLDL
jgi:hypothetical protein